MSCSHTRVCSLGPAFLFSWQQHDWFEQSRLTGASWSMMGWAGRKQLPACFASCCFTRVPWGSGFDSEGRRCQTLAMLGKSFCFLMRRLSTLTNLPLMCCCPWSHWHSERWLLTQRESLNWSLNFWAQLCDGVFHRVNLFKFKKI